MDLHDGESIVFRGHPSWRSILGFYLTGLVVALVLGAIAWFAVSEVAGGLTAFGVFDLVLVIGLLKRIGTTYVITTERLHIRRGILSKATQETRLERVQNVNTDQSVFERVLQVGTVDFDTAGTDDSEFRFAGVAEPDEVVQAVEQARRAAAPGPSSAV